ncbi:MAG TPA: hypothetical protein VJC21_03095 [Candidatus Nanoarchaeia archaeon]|nr:hypothetical protein [Candidatus Nanoarchaeia archaeon]
MQLYKLSSNEKYKIYEADHCILEIEYHQAAYSDGEIDIDGEWIFLASQAAVLSITREKAEEPWVTSNTFGDNKLDDKILDAIKMLPEHITSLIIKGLERSALQ